MAKSQFSLRRKQALRGKSSPVTKKTPNKGLMPVSKPRPGCLPPGRTYLPSKEGMLERGAPWACAGSAPRWDPRSPSTLCCQALAQELLGLAAVDGLGCSAVRCTGGRGKAARQARAAFSAHSSVPAQPHRLGRGGKGR